MIGGDDNMMPEEKYAALDSCDGGTPVVAKPGTAMLPNLIDVCDIMYLAYVFVYAHVSDCVSSPSVWTSKSIYFNFLLANRS